MKLYFKKYYSIMYNINIILKKKYILRYSKTSEINLYESYIYKQVLISYTNVLFRLI